MEVCYKKRNHPLKGDVIKIDMDGDGVKESYLVLKTESNDVLQCLARTNVSGDNISFGPNNRYNGSNADIFCNSTWYNRLSSVAKAAIVDTTITQYSYKYVTEVYDSNTHASYADMTSQQIKEEGLVRHAYILGVQDIEEYFNHTFSQNDLCNFINTTSGIFWLRSGNGAATSTAAVWALATYNYKFLSTSMASDNVRHVRPAFKIDISQIEYSFDDGRSDIELVSVLTTQKIISNSTASQKAVLVSQKDILDGGDSE